MSDRAYSGLNPGDWREIAIKHEKEGLKLREENAGLEALVIKEKEENAKLREENAVLVVMLEEARETLELLAGSRRSWMDQVYMCRTTLNRLSLDNYECARFSGFIRDGQGHFNDANSKGECIAVFSKDKE